MAAGASVSGVGATAFTPPDGARGCRLRAGAAGGRAVAVTVELDTLPQPYARLEREAVECAQNGVWSSHPANPRTLPGLGLDAYWFPGDEKVMTTGGERLVTVRVSWPGSGPGRRTLLAERVARALLGPLHPV